MSVNVLLMRKELVIRLLKELKDNYRKIDEAAAYASSDSSGCYDRAVDEMKDELQSIVDEYNMNIDRIREINNEITASVNGWYDFLKDRETTSKLSFPLTFNIRRKKLNKEIDSLNKQITELTINNRFLKEKLTAARLKLEIRAVDLAYKGEGYNEYEKLMQKNKDLAAELKYLLPTIPGLCPADITASGIDTTITATERVLQPPS